MTGYICLHRGWRDCDVFSDEPMTEREAWLWLIENAAWKPMTRTNAKGERIRIERGQMHVSLRNLEKVFGWGKNKVARFLQRLEDAEMIGTASGQSGTVLTVCNYAKYQDARDSRDSQTGTASGQSRDTQEEGKPVIPSEPITTNARAKRFELPSDIPAEAWAGFEEMRRKIGKPMTDRAKGLAITELRKLSDSGWPPGDVLNHCTLNSYQGIYPPKDRQNGNRPANDRSQLTSALYRASLG